MKTSNPSHTVCRNGSQVKPELVRFQAGDAYRATKAALGTARATDPRLDGLDQDTRLVAVKFLQHANRHGRTFVGLKRIAEDCRFGHNEPAPARGFKAERSMRRHVKILRDVRFLGPRDVRSVDPDDPARVFGRPRTIWQILPLSAANDSPPSSTPSPTPAIQSPATLAEGDAQLWPGVQRQHQNGGDRNRL